MSNAPNTANMNYSNCLYPPLIKTPNFLDQVVLELLCITNNWLYYDLFLGVLDVPISLPLTYTEHS